MHFAPENNNLEPNIIAVIGIHKQNHSSNSFRQKNAESINSAVSTADGYYEDEPTVAGWFREITPSGRDVVHFIYSLFPFLHWITRYNLQWLTGDLIAGKSLH